MVLRFLGVKGIHFWRDQLKLGIASDHFRRGARLGDPH